MPRYALINLGTLEVRNVATISTVPAAPPGFRNLVENMANPTLSDWTPGNDPLVGWFWDGGIPAVFTAPPEPVDLPATVPEATAAVNVAMAELQRRQAQLEALLGTEEV